MLVNTLKAQLFIRLISWFLRQCWRCETGSPQSLEIPRPKMFDICCSYEWIRTMTLFRKISLNWRSKTSWSRQLLNVLLKQRTFKIVSWFNYVETNNSFYKIQKIFQYLNCQEECRPFSSLQHFKICTLAFIIMISGDWKKIDTTLQKATYLKGTVKEKWKGV